MENLLYAIKNAKEIKIVEIDFDLFQYSIGASVGDLLITYDVLLGIVYYYLYHSSTKKYDSSWKNVKIEKVADSKKH